MDEMDVSPFMIPLMSIMIPITAIIGSFVFIIIKALAKARVRELEIKERIAMIERGLVPAPEVDPRGFDRAMSRLDRHESRHGSGRHQRAGVTLMGVGFGLMVLIGVAFGNTSAGLGVGGFLVIMGLAFFINSRFEPRDAAASHSTSSPPTP